MCGADFPQGQLDLQGQTDLQIFLITETYFEVEGFSRGGTADVRSKDLLDDVMM